MICPVCGKEIADGSAVCPICGAALTAAAAPAADAQPVVAQPVVAEVLPMPKNVKQFLNQRKDVPEYNKMRKEINSAAILFYIFAGITALVNVVLAQNIAGLLDVAILVALGLWLHLKYSRTASIVALVYSIANLIYILAQTGKPGGYLIVIIAAIAVFYTFKAASAFKKFKKNAENAQ